MAGFNCRYNGSNKECEKVVKLVQNGEAIPVCPEQLGGLMTPRQAAEGPKDGKILTEDGTDYTAEFIKGAKETLLICQKYNCKKAILKSCSPSCGSNQIYDGNFNGTLISGDGVTAKMLKENDIEVISEKEI